MRCELTDSFGFWNSSAVSSKYFENISLENIVLKSKKHIPNQTEKQRLYLQDNNCISSNWKYLAIVKRDLVQVTHIWFITIISFQEEQEYNNILAF